MDPVTSLLVSVLPKDWLARCREEWLARCAARLRERAALPETQARQIAEAQLENLNEDLGESPEDAADDEISCWTAD